PKLTFPKRRGGKRPPPRRRAVYLSNTTKPVSCAIYARETLPPGARIPGPALIEEHGTTTVLYAGDQCRVAPSGELIIAVGGNR
ncbi:MAG: hypothetical protein WBQ24_12800, partial [Xanthobacteraceae bacterium]